MLVCTGYFYFGPTGPTGPTELRSLGKELPLYQKRGACSGASIPRCRTEKEVDQLDQLDHPRKVSAYAHACERMRPRIWSK